MPYNLPGPWDPGYALPKNVVEEGLQRRGFVTKQMPRGTYDNPSVGDGGYDVPQYVKDEGYGQGTYTTKWAPSGTYAGPRIPPWLNQHPQVTKTRALPGGGRAVTMLSGFGDAELPPAFEDYGAKAAQILLARVQQVPAKQRQKTLKQIMDKIDSSLWGRSQQIWKRFIAQGTPPAQALPMAIGRAMSTGLAAEIIDTGLRRSAPQAKSLLGLGCYGCLAVLGEDAPADCTTSPGFSWIYGSAGIPGHWERTKAGATDVPSCKTPPAGAATVDPTTTDVRDHTIAKDANYVAVAPTADFAEPIYFPRTTPTDKVRDFSKPPDIIIPAPSMTEAQADSMRKAGVHVMSDLPLSWKKWMVDVLTTPADYKNMKWTYQIDPGQAGDYFYSTMLGIPSGTTINEATGSYIPRAWVEWPIDGSQMGIYFYYERLNRCIECAGYSTDPVKNPMVLKIWLSKIPPDNTPLLGQFANSIYKFFAKAVNVVVDAVKDLADLACDALSGPLSGSQGQAAGAAAAGAAGVPPQAGAVGAALAQKACGGKPPTTAPVVTKSSMLTVLLLAGGAVAAVALLTMDKKK